MWLTCFRGIAIVLVLLASIVAGQNDLEDFVKHANAHHLSDNHGYLLKEGDTVYCPIGSWPCILGVTLQISDLAKPGKLHYGTGTKLFKLAREEFVTIGVTTAYDNSKQLNKIPKRILRHTAFLWHEVEDRLPPSIAKHKEVLNWKEALLSIEPDETVVAVTDA